MVAYVCQISTNNWKEEAREAALMRPASSIWQLSFLDIAPFAPGVLQHGRSDRQYKHTRARTPGGVGCVWRAAAPKWTAIVAMGCLIMESTWLYFSNTPKNIIRVEIRGTATLKLR